MNIVEVMFRLLGRRLTAEEFECLCRLTPQGIAKINSDIAAGILPSETMVTLLTVHRAMQRRRVEVFEKLSGDMRKLLDGVCHAVSTEVVVFLNDCMQSGLLGAFMEAHGGKLPSDFDLENCALTYLMSDLAHLDEDCEELARMTKLRIHRLHLASTVCPEDLTMPWFLHLNNSNNKSTPTTTIKRQQRNSISLRISPIVTWFYPDDQPDSPPEVSMDPIALFRPADEIENGKCAAATAAAHTSSHPKFSSACGCPPPNCRDPENVPLNVTTPADAEAVAAA